MKHALLFAIFLLSFSPLARAQTAPAKAQLPPATPQYRPGYHFSPAAHWMNDPNGLVYLNGTYHLFFQYYPDGVVWGPMHWGHATSPDLVHWQEQPIALYPDSLGWIFSGSAVVDKDNTAGFGPNALVAVFTHHNDPEEKKHTNRHQYQSLAYSLDEGKTWTKYDGNPVLPNPGIPDFRDPKVSWHEASKRWVMALATKDRITFYASPNLKNWTKLSEFGQIVGAHGGVWECPDLFPLPLEGRQKWVLLVSINPGGLHGGSATQYFVGQFDGSKFTPDDTQTRWLDYGKDNYAGVTFNNLPAQQRVFVGWMSNWEYADKVPTSPWRNAMTAPRLLSLRRVGQQVLLAAQPTKEVMQYMPTGTALRDLRVSTELDLTPRLPRPLGKQFQLQLSTPQLQSFALVFGNSRGEELLIGYDQPANQYYIDRGKAGRSAFSPSFAGRHAGPRHATTPAADLTLLVDASSVEVFADGGLTTLTDLFFPTEPYTTVKLRSAPGLTVDVLRLLRPAAGTK